MFGVRMASRLAPRAVETAGSIRGYRKYRHRQGSESRGGKRKRKQSARAVSLDQPILFPATPTQDSPAVSVPRPNAAYGTKLLPFPFEAPLGDMEALEDDWYTRPEYREWVAKWNAQFAKDA